MEPVTHLLTGACLSRAGLNRRTAYATLAMVLAAEAPDIDVVWYLRGPITGLAHHRGISHTLIAAPVLALVTTGLVWGWHKLRERLPGKLRRKPLSQKVSWLWIFLLSLIAVLSHLLLDYTNAYGLRAFFPFNPRWYSGDLVFILEPVMLLLLIFALVMPWLFGLADREIGARRAQFPNRGWAWFAIVGILLMWGWRWVEHDKALALMDNGALTGDRILKRSAVPYPVNPYRWALVAETPESFIRGHANTLTGEVDSSPIRDTLYKQQTTLAALNAKRSYLGQIYLDWSAYPYVEDIGPVPVAGVAPPMLAAGQQWTTIRFRDLRYNYSDLLGNRESPMTAYAYVLNSREMAAMILNGKEEDQ
jgi:inner membrane protein